MRLRFRTPPPLRAVIINHRDGYKHNRGFGTLDVHEQIGLIKYRLVGPRALPRRQSRPYPVTRYRFGNTNPVLIKRLLCACPTRGVLRRNATRGAVTIITSRVVRSRFSSPQRGDKQYARARVGQLYCMLFRFDSAEQTRRLV